MAEEERLGPPGREQSRPANRLAFLVHPHTGQFYKRYYWSIAEVTTRKLTNKENEKIIKWYSHDPHDWNTHSEVLSGVVHLFDWLRKLSMKKESQINY